jgi:DNA primase catalytic subunit
VELADNSHSSMIEEESHQSIKEISIRGEPSTTRMRKHTQRLVDEKPIAMVTISLENIEIPKSLIKALKRKNNDFWREAAVVEFRAIHNTNTFKKITLELLQKIKRNELQVHGTRAILTVKTNVKEEISRSKV